MSINEQINACEKQLLQAMKSADVKKLDSLIHNNLVFVNHQGMLFTKEMDLQAYRSGSLKVNNINVVDLKMNCYDDCAVVNVILEMSGSYLEHTFNDTVRFVRTWKKFDDRWQIISGNSSVIAV